MGKRFTDTDKWKDEWFTDLDPILKCFWVYLCDTCDCAGVWRVNFKQASFNVGAIIDKQSSLKAFDKRVRVLSDDKWFIEKFIKFQYPKGLSGKCSAHVGVIKSLKYNNIETNSYLTLVEDLPNSSVTIQDKDKDKDLLPSSFSSLKESGAKKILSKVQSEAKLKTDQIEELFNSMLAGVGQIKHCRMLSGGDREELITTISFPQLSKIENWVELFEIVKNSAFLTGQNDSNFVVSMNWLCKQGNCSKVLNGQYSGLDKLSRKTTPKGNPYTALRKQAEEKGEIA